MNFKNILASFLLLFVLIGCSLEGDSNQTPQIALAAYPKIQSGDTLEIKSTNENNVFSVDTIQVGDTISFVLYMLSYHNDLTAFYLTQSEDSSALIVLPDLISMDSVFMAHSEYENGKFYMNPGFNTMYFPFKYVAKKENSETRIGFRVVSDAVFENSIVASNTSAFELITPIKARIE
jgi:plastocyanin